MQQGSSSVRRTAAKTTFNLKKAVATEITEVSEEKQKDTTNDLIPFG
jgi:hypothetical protein